MFTCATLVAAAAASSLNPDGTHPITYANATAATAQSSDCKRSAEFSTLLKFKRLCEGNTILSCNFVFFF